jgi:hypothetical protein
MYIILNNEKIHNMGEIVLCDIFQIWMYYVKKEKKKGTSVGFEPTSGAYECRVFCMAVKSGESLAINLISFSNTICAIFTYPSPHLVRMLAVDLLCTRNNKTH